MTQNYDEPMFIDPASAPKECPEEQVEAEIRGLCLEQPFAVLAVQGEGQPYTSLISFAFSEDLRHLIFATPTRTRKYNLISENKNISILIDNRSRQPESINLIRGLTITGRAEVLSDPEEIKRWSGILTERHSYMEKFIEAPTTSLILVNTEWFFYVRRFQEVYRWAPGNY